MKELIQGAGVFFWLLLPCSVAAVYIFFERLHALRKAAVMPEDTVRAVLDGKPLQPEDISVLARIARFATTPGHEDSAVLAYARLEINRMERGFSFLEFIVGAAPMVGLMGTVTALMRVFGALNPETGVAAQTQLTQGISLALSTTFLGLVIAVPSLFFVGNLQRRVETYAVQIEALIERMRPAAPPPKP
jgi:biopolymer transport protein ExbB